MAIIDVAFVIIFDDEEIMLFGGLDQGPCLRCSDIVTVVGN